MVFCFLTCVWVMWVFETSKLDTHGMRTFLYVCILNINYNLIKSHFKKKKEGNSLVVQWLRPCFHC